MHITSIRLDRCRQVQLPLLLFCPQLLLSLERSAAASSVQFITRSVLPPAAPVAAAEVFAALSGWTLYGEKCALHNNV